MERGDIASLARDVGLEDVADELATASQDGFRLVYTPERPGLGASKLGGLPDLPPGSGWPRRSDVGPFTFIGQVALGELATQPAWTGPRDGLLSFFCARHAEHGGVEAPGAAVVLHTPPAEDLVRLEPPAELDGENRFGEVAVVARPELCLPDVDDPGIHHLGLHFGGPRRHDYERAWRLGEAIVAAQGFDGHPRHRLLGHAVAVQEHPLVEIESSMERAARWRLLLQVEAEYDRLGQGFGDGGTVFFVAPAEALASGAYESVEALSHCH